MRCEVGDLSGKHGPFTFYSVGKNGRKLMADQFLPLTGQHSGTLPISTVFLLCRLLVIHVVVLLSSHVAFHRLSCGWKRSRTCRMRHSLSRRAQTFLGDIFQPTNNRPVRRSTTREEPIVMRRFSLYRTDLRMSIARGLGVSPDDVKYLDYKADDSGQCGSATFALPGQSFLSL